MDQQKNISHKNGLVLDRVTKLYQSVFAVDHVCLKVENRGFLAIVGPTGCEKTTLLRLIAGVEKLDSGHICIQGRCVDDVKPARRGVRMVFQDHALWPHMRVFHKAILPASLSKISLSVLRSKLITFPASRIANIGAPGDGIFYKL